MEVKGGRRGLFADGKLVRGSLIVAAVILVAAAIIAGPSLSPSMAAESQNR